MGFVARKNEPRNELSGFHNWGFIYDVTLSTMEQRYWLREPE